MPPRDNDALFKKGHCRKICLVGKAATKTYFFSHRVQTRGGVVPSGGFGEDLRPKEALLYYVLRRRASGYLDFRRFTPQQSITRPSSQNDRNRNNSQGQRINLIILFLAPWPTFRIGIFKLIFCEHRVNVIYFSKKSVDFLFVMRILF